MTTNEDIDNWLPVLIPCEVQNNIVTPSLPNISNIRNYFEEEIDRSNCGYIDTIKASRNVWILSLNPHGCRLYDIKKIFMLK